MGCMKKNINELEIIYCFRKFRELHKDSIRLVCKRFELSVYEADILTFLLTVFVIARVYRELGAGNGAAPRCRESR